MREIKFRAWSEDFSQMIPWEELKFDKDENTDRICFYEQEDGSDSVWNGGADYKIMQYTNLKDKNGKDIYEGDVYLNPLGNKMEILYELEEARFAGRSLKISRKLPLLNFRGKLNGEIIGNIYENPSLLERS